MLVPSYYYTARRNESAMDQPQEKLVHCTYYASNVSHESPHKWFCSRNNRAFQQSDVSADMQGGVMWLPYGQQYGRGERALTLRAEVSQLMGTGYTVTTPPCPIKLYVKGANLRNTGGAWKEGFIQPLLRS